MAFHIPARKDVDFYACDILSDILANGRSARLYQILVKQRDCSPPLMPIPMAPGRRFAYN